MMKVGRKCYRRVDNMIKIKEFDEKKVYLFINISMVIIIALFSVGTTIAIMRLINAQNTINQCEKLDRR